ncbi:MAG: type 1 glutamine amidotransferase [Haloarculaceae archaeon]
MDELRVALLVTFTGDGSPDNFHRDIPADLETYWTADGELPDFDDVDAAVVTGSGASAYWDEEWIHDLREWLAEADERGMPLFGVCFGHQILAAALGGEVGDMGEYELGYATVTHTGTSPLFEGIDREFTAFATHHDEVTALPPGAEAIAENEWANHGYRRGHAFGVQFHPEFDRDTALRVIDMKELPDAELDAARATVTDENVAAAQRAKRVFDNFCRYAAEATGTRAPTAPADD